MFWNGFWKQFDLSTPEKTDIECDECATTSHFHLNRVISCIVVVIICCCCSGCLSHLFRSAIGTMLVAAVGKQMGLSDRVIISAEDDRGGGGSYGGGGYGMPPGGWGGGGWSGGRQKMGWSS